MFDSWLTETKKLQLEAYGVDFDAMIDKEKIGYINWNTLAAQVELGEMLQELPWKPWAQGHEIASSARDAAIKEMIDVLHFISNILCALDCTDDELSAKYRIKMEINADRQRNGYHNKGVAERTL